MSYVSNLGQADGLIAMAGTLASQVITTSGTYQRDKLSLDAQLKMQKEMDAAQAALAGKDIAFKQSQFATQVAISNQRDTTIKQIAIYAFIGIALLAFTITGGVLYISKKPKQRKR